MRGRPGDSKDEAFVGSTRRHDVPERKILTKIQLGFTILAHAHTGKEGEQSARSRSVLGDLWSGGAVRPMSDWRSSRPPSPTSRKVRLATSHTLKPGMAHVYNEGDRTAAPRRTDATDPDRGLNMDKVKRLAYERV